MDPREGYLKDRYTARVIDIVENVREDGRKAWNSTIVGVFDGEELIGSYERNYPTLYETFHPFHLNGKEMDLATCEDLGGEDHDIDRVFINHRDCWDIPDGRKF